MIVPMKKVALVVLEKERREALKQLRKLGVVQLEELQGSSDELASYRDQNNKLVKAISLLSDIKVSKSVLKNQKKLEKSAALELAAKVVSLTEQKKNCLDRMTADRNEIERLNGWGEVNPAELASLSEKGVYLSLYEIPAAKYTQIGDGVKTLLVSRDKAKARFLVISDSADAERPAVLPPEAFAVVLPRCAVSELKASLVDAQKQIADIDREIASDVQYLEALKACLPSLAKDIELENAYSGMGYESKAVADKAEDAEKAAPAVPLAWVTGFVPVDDLAALQSYAKAQSWALAVSDPAEDEFVPTKLKNNKLVSVIYPLTDFLDVTPGYREFDISGWFLLFFCIFFAMIFGDACYGALIALAGLAVLVKSKKGSRSLGVLVTMLGFCTMLWGIMTCSWFGIEASKLPKALVDLSFAPFSAAKSGTDVANTNQKIFCFALALIQLSVAHLKCMAADRKSLKFFGDMGSLFMIWGMFYVVMNMVVDSAKYPLSDTGAAIPIFGGALALPSNFPLISLGVLGLGFLLNFIFANYEGSVGKSVLESVKNIISVLLGVVNQFSDIVSYIRLWAVALAGAAISGTVNTMAGPMFGKMVMMIFGVVLLVFGHGLNMILNLLSVIVHGVRLNTLEFSQHLGMTWSGQKFRPFSE
ncbi:MAG: ATPase [Treponema sp.]|nr:ATPase [Treponema sp.]